MAEDLIYGINPIKEAINAKRDLDKLYVVKSSQAVTNLANKAKAMGTPVIAVDERRMDQIIGEKVVHQGICALVSQVNYCDVTDMLALAKEKGEDPLIVILDGVQDPHNLGAIARSAEIMGAHGIIVPKRGSAPLSGTAMKASAGALNHIGVARVPNLASVLDVLKNNGLWIAAADMGCPDCDKTNLTGPLALCMGSEGDGVSRLLLERCDIKTGIPMQGRTESLNVSAAAAILLYEIARQRRG
ncbi:MAG: 23S rRNA (guanosine(2251)-2'-O)-methyltransferase RlmB [Clostridiales bacterium]|nr:23S rRNA (guanosine(2251)-2'-O)-methyltransferase RlmB [Clostridiales bacterium]